jgi:ABC-2 type transport system permease protein
VAKEDNFYFMSAIYILWLRQIKRHFRSVPRVVGSLGQPLLFLVSLGYGFGSVFQQAGQGNYINFLAPGIIAMSIIFSAIFSGMEIIWDKQFGFLKETLVAPIPRINIMVGRTLGGATVSTMQGTIVLLISVIAGFRFTHWSILPISIAVMFLIAMLFTALGTLIASTLADMQGFQMIVNFLVMPLFFLSGALFPLEGLPWAMEVIAKINPLTYGVDLLRGLLIAANHFSLGLDLAIMAGVTMLFMVLGGYFFSKIQV